MRLHYKTLALATGFVAALAGAALAGQAAPTTTGEKQALVEAREELTARAAATKGAPRAQYDLERRRVDSLIDALERGQRVSPSVDTPNPANDRQLKTGHRRAAGTMGQ